MVLKQILNIIYLFLDIFNKQLQFRYKGETKLGFSAMIRTLRSHELNQIYPLDLFNFCRVFRIIFIVKLVITYLFEIFFI